MIFYPNPGVSLCFEPSDKCGVVDRLRIRGDVGWDDGAESNPLPIGVSALTPAAKDAALLPRELDE